MPKENKQQNTQQEEQPKNKQPQEREIIIKTDGNNIKLEKAEVTGNIELRAILSLLLENISKRDK